MNERIKELAISKGIFDSLCDPFDELKNGDGYSSVMVDLAKFAELIVQECVGVADHSNVNSKSIIGQRIKEHFGVEEPKGWVCSKCGIDRTKAVCPKGHTAALTGECPMIGVAQ